MTFVLFCNLRQSLTLRLQMFVSTGGMHEGVWQGCPGETQRGLVLLTLWVTVYLTCLSPREGHHTPHTWPQHDHGARRREREHCRRAHREHVVQGAVAVAQEIRAQEENAEQEHRPRRPRASRGARAQGEQWEQTKGGLHVRGEAVCKVC